jgi:serine/threonine protein kinase
MLRLDPSKRITCLEALAHPYFNDLDKEQFAKPEP